MKTTLVLLLNNCAAPHLAARVHVETCRMVNMARPGRRVSQCPADQETIDDLNARGFQVKFCRCCEL